MDSIDQLLTRRVEKILPSKEGLEKLLGQRQIRVYFGVDPTATKLHLGHTIGLRKLQEFAAAGHEAILLFGTGTVLVGDPSLRSQARKPITQTEINANIATWKKQVEPMVDFDKVTIKQNGDWLLKLTLKDIVHIASHISAVQLFKRDMFQRRIEAGDTVWYHETMYPLLQGYDSVAMDVDLEIGGTDQEFNMLIGRELLRKMNHKEKFVLTTPMILGTDGQQMSKTTGNCVWLTDTPEDIFGKLMSIPDDQIDSYRELLTDLTPATDTNPMAAKKELAQDIVRQFHGASAAQVAQTNFKQTFQNQAPQYDIPIVLGNNLAGTISSEIGSMSEAKRLIRQGSVDINGATINDPTYQVKVGDNIKIGKKIFRKVIKP